MKTVLGILASTSILGWSLFIVRELADHSWRTENPQAMDGTWKVYIQVPPCDSGIKFNLPEREGDVVILDCEDMPIKAK